MSGIARKSFTKTLKGFRQEKKEEHTAQCTRLSAQAFKAVAWLQGWLAV